MKIAAVICNIVLFGFTCMVIATDGFPEAALYIVFTLWTLATLGLTALIISRIGASEGWQVSRAQGENRERQPGVGRPHPVNTIIRIAAIVCNIVFLAFVCWAIVDQYPHPDEEGIIAFTALMVLTPILSLLVLFKGLSGRLKRKTLENQIAGQA